MSSCECCRDCVMHDAVDPIEAYYEVMAEHEARGCVCTKPGIEGDRARAGQFWDESRQVDTRNAKVTP